MMVDGVEMCLVVSLEGVDAEAVKKTVMGLSPAHKRAIGASSLFGPNEEAT